MGAGGGSGWLAACGAFFGYVSKAARAQKRKRPAQRNFVLSESTEPLPPVDAQELGRCLKQVIVCPVAVEIVLVYPSVQKLVLHCVQKALRSGVFFYIFLVEANNIFGGMVMGTAVQISDDRPAH